MFRTQSSRSGFARLELLLVLAVLALFFQVFPSLWWAMFAALDLRTWSRGTWFALNLLVLAALFGIRFGPGLYADWRKQRERRRRNSMAQTESTPRDADYEARVRRDADWRARAKKRLPWY